MLECHSATPATRNEATRLLKYPSITFAELSTDTCEQLLTVADGCKRLRTVAQPRANTPWTRVKREPLLRIREKYRKRVFQDVKICFILIAFAIFSLSFPGETGTPWTPWSVTLGQSLDVVSHIKPHNHPKFEHCGGIPSAHDSDVYRPPRLVVVQMTLRLYHSVRPASMFEFKSRSHSIFHRQSDWPSTKNGNLCCLAILMYSKKL